ncbi:MAG: hypothetical protein NZT61_02220 [Deltaproteobacteria bacterium]|nr:hypothetical protein [Deltaproteobacteria bacterium]
MIRLSKILIFLILLSEADGINTSKVAIFRAKRHIEEAARLVDIARQKSQNILPFSPDQVIDTLKQQARELDKAINPRGREGEAAARLEPKFQSEKIFIEQK